MCFFLHCYLRRSVYRRRNRRLHQYNGAGERLPAPANVIIILPAQGVVKCFFHFFNLFSSIFSFLPISASFSSILLRHFIFPYRAMPCRDSPETARSRSSGRSAPVPPSLLYNVKTIVIDLRKRGWYNNNQPVDCWTVDC